MTSRLSLPVTGRQEPGPPASQSMSPCRSPDVASPEKAECAFWSSCLQWVWAMWKSCQLPLTWTHLSASSSLESWELSAFLSLASWPSCFLNLRAAGRAGLCDVGMLSPGTRLQPSSLFTITAQNALGLGSGVGVGRHIVTAAPSRDAPAFRAQSFPLMIACQC